MKKRTRLLIAIFVLPTLLSACIIVPWDDGYYYRGGHHHGGYYDGGYYDHGGYYDRGRRGGYYDRRR